MAECADPIAALAALVQRAWLVGGAVRDHVLGRPTADFDVVVDASVREVARKLGRAAGGFSFELSHSFGAWRVVARDRSWQVDLTPLDGDTIDDDLAKRDLTINAIAEPLDGGARVDPFGGVEDLRGRRLRAVSTRAFEADPLRVMRVARIACELGFEIEPDTLALARRAAAGLSSVAAERVFAELRRVVCAPAALAGLELMETVGATAVVLPELAALRGVEQSRFHHLDVLDHTLLTLEEAIALVDDPGRLASDGASELAAHLAQPLADEMTRGQALRFGALLHDIAKPATRDVTPEGRITFMGHDLLGAELCGTILGRLRASERMIEHVGALTRHHLRLGFMVRDMPLDRRAVYGYLHATAPVGVDVTVLSVADRLATRGDNSQVAIERHLELARQMVGEGLAWAANPPRPPVRGDVLARALSLAPGPVIGELLAELEAASFAGEVAGPDDAIARARSVLATARGASG
ncbi:MAG: HDIG domain-containing metalloprotein [Solirubrobacteraceae bacterium]